MSRLTTRNQYINCSVLRGLSGLVGPCVYRAEKRLEHGGRVSVTRGAKVGQTGKGVGRLDILPGAR